MVDPFALTAFAVISTLRGDVPLETWFPLFEDIVRNIADSAINIIMNLLEVLM
ncbi:MAG: hypothetical protein U0K91_05155 [Acutalibacteraceae bacterium]|nr:hypothetical protein [Acutalibacteraceae bacterium]